LISPFSVATAPELARKIGGNISGEVARSVPVVPDFSRNTVQNKTVPSAHGYRFSSEKKRSHLRNEEKRGQSLSSEDRADDGSAQLARWLKKEASGYHGKNVVKRQSAQQGARKKDHHHEDVEQELKSQTPTSTNPVNSITRWLTQAGKHMRGKLRGGE